MFVEPLVQNLFQYPRKRSVYIIRRSQLVQAESLFAPSSQPLHVHQWPPVTSNESEERTEKKGH